MGLKVRDVAVIRNIYSKVRNSISHIERGKVQVKLGGQGKKKANNEGGKKLYTFKQISKAVYEATKKSHIEKILVEAVNERTCVNNLKDVVEHVAKVSENDRELVDGLATVIASLEKSLNNGEVPGVASGGGAPVAGLSSLMEILQEINNSVKRVQG